MLDVDRYGQVIFNENPDDGSFELEVEVEECMDLAGSTNVDVYRVLDLDVELIGTIDIDEMGNGKVTIPVESISTLDSIRIDDTLISGDWRDWIKGPGKK